MENPIKKLARLQGKKKYLFLAFLAVEIVSLPAAAAQIIQHVSFDVRPFVTAVEIPTAERGVSRYLVSSNAGFGVEAINISGDVSVEVHSSGSLGGNRTFGDAAQLPGPQSHCAIASGVGTKIYVADRKTAATKGTPPEQAVVFEFRYDETTKPIFDFISDSESSSPVKFCENTAN